MLWCIQTQLVARHFTFVVYQTRPNIKGKMVWLRETIRCHEPCSLQLKLRYLYVLFDVVREEHVRLLELLRLKRL